MQRFSSCTLVPVSAERALLWATRGRTIERLIPPWLACSLVSTPCAGDREPARFRLGRRVPWTIRRQRHTAARELWEEQIEGPFAHWQLVQRFRPHDRGCVIEEEVEFDLSFPSPFAPFGMDALLQLLRRVAQFRRFRMQTDLARHARFADEGLRAVAIEGEGVVADRLSTFLATGGHRVVTFPGALAESDIMPGLRVAPPLEGLDALVYFCDFGWPAFFGRPHPSATLYRLRQRVGELLRLQHAPRALLLVTTVGIYGDRGDEPIGEHVGPGRDALARWARACEQACEPLAKAGVRVVHLRVGFPLGGEGGLLPRLRRAMRFGLGAGFAPGNQYWSWIDADDAVGALHQALFDETLAGPVNVASPEALRAADVITTLGEILHRRRGLHWPLSAVRTAIGPVCTQWLSASIRAQPRALLERGFEFALPRIEETLRYELGRGP